MNNIEERFISDTCDTCLECRVAAASNANLALALHTWINMFR